MEVLIGQFSRFAVDSDLCPDDWEMVTTEFGVKEILWDIDRFHKSWEFNDEDQQANTAKFLREVAGEDEEKAVGLMRRMYTLIDTSPELLEKYPALEILENGDAGTGVPYPSFRAEQFLDINNIPGTFYPDLIKDINQCYSIGIHDATLVLTRKLLENLLIDVLRRQYGKQEIELYYLPENRRFQNFSTLINNFEDNLADFQHLSGGLDGDFIDELDSFRQNANAEAHSIETNITESQMEDYQKQVRHASQILFQVRENL